MTRWADRDAVENAAEGWSNSQIHCRIYGHSWRPLTVTHDRHGYVVTQRCSRCRNERSQDMDHNGYAGSWRMSYREGYLLKDLGRVDGDGRAVLRLAALRDLTVLEVSDDE